MGHETAGETRTDDLTTVWTGRERTAGKKNKWEGASLWAQQGAPSQSMTLALARLHLPCQPQSAPRHHLRSDPLPA